MAGYNRRGLRSALKRKAEINMIPFLDVLLTLLLIFMVATPVVNPTLNVDVPQSSAAKVNPDQNTKDVLIVEVHDNNTYTIIYNANDNTETYSDLTQNNFIGKMNAILSEVKDANKDFSNIIVQLAADQDIAYAKVVKALSYLRSFGFTDVGLVTKPNGTGALNINKLSILDNHALASR